MNSSFSAMSPLNPASMLQQTRVVIVGGSISGLMHGILLKHYGYNVRILEQSTSLERADLAAGISTHPQFEEFMKRFDTTGKQWSIPSPGIQFLNKDASVKRTINKALQMTSWGVLYSHLRTSFDEIGNLGNDKAGDHGSDRGSMVKKMDGTTFEPGKRVTRLSQIGEELEITYANLLNAGQEETVKADFVIIADGHKSKLRDDLFPSTKHTYAGYVAFRGTVPESNVSEESKKIFDPKLTYQTFNNGYILLYIIPGTDGSLEVGHRRYNWVWYHPLAANSPAFTEIMTDTAGTVHRNTLPMGGMQPTAWAQYVSLASEVMCAPFAEMIQKTTQPFIMAINDAYCPRAMSHNGKVIVVGEALNLMRPHMALSATQSAVQALELEGVLKGKATMEEWESKVVHWGRVSALKTNAFGTFFLYGPFAAGGWLCKLVWLFLGRVWPFSLLSSLKRTESWKK